MARVPVQSLTGVAFLALQDYELPQASINRIIKAKLPENIQVGKDAKTAFSKAAGIFIIYVTAAANDFCKEHKRQTISAQDVLESMKELEFEDFVEPLEKFLEGKKALDDLRVAVRGIGPYDVPPLAAHRKEAEDKKAGAKAKKAADGEENAEAEEGADAAEEPADEEME
jgi:DNA polymerase epsilon subunit 3